MHSRFVSKTYAKNQGCVIPKLFTQDISPFFDRPFHGSSKDSKPNVEQFGYTADINFLHSSLSIFNRLREHIIYKKLQTTLLPVEPINLIDWDWLSQVFRLCTLEECCRSLIDKKNSQQVNVESL